MYANPAKVQVMFLSLKSNNSLCLHIYGQKVKQSQHVKMLGGQVDSKSNFNIHFNMLFKELFQKKSYVHFRE